jgi:DNA-binding XRE family transcriptional regulator
MDLRDALIDWDEPDDEGSNTAHISEHGLTPEEVEAALLDEYTTFDVSQSASHPGDRSPLAAQEQAGLLQLCSTCSTWRIRSSSVRSPPTMFPNQRSEAMKPTIKLKRTAEQRAEEEAVRRQHAANPIRQQPAGAINRQSFAAILSLVARFKSVRENKGLTLADVAERMGIDAPALSRLETGKMLNPTLATLHKWAEALGQKLEVDLSSD